MLLCIFLTCGYVAVLTTHIILNTIEQVLFGKFIEILDDSLSDYWVLGFDTFHFGDNQYDWNKENCIQETLKLKHILEGI